MEFAEFYARFPRRMARKKAEAAWRKLSSEQRQRAVEALPDHIRYWEATGMDFIPYPATWLNQERWTDELTLPEKKVPDDWMKTTAGIAAKAKELGIEPKMGEDWHSLKARILGRAA